jgi:high-affinity K+ transport system ATPase subunit B
VLFANFAEAVAEGRGKAQAESLKNRVDAKDILVDLDFAGTMKKLYPTELEAAQAANDAAPASATPVDETSTPAT